MCQYFTLGLKQNCRTVVIKEDLIERIGAQASSYTATLDGQNLLYNMEIDAAIHASPFSPEMEQNT